MRTQEDGRVKLMSDLTGFVGQNAASGSCKFEVECKTSEVQQSTRPHLIPVIPHPLCAACAVVAVSRIP